MLDQSNLEQTVTRLSNSLVRLERRLGEVELVLGLQEAMRDTPPPIESMQDDSVKTDEEALEFQIGELWVGQVGIVALLIGVAFLISFPFGIHPAVQSLMGYVTVGLGFWVARQWLASHAPISHTLFVGCLALLYFTTLRLHFFNLDPLISQKVPGLALCTVSVGFTVYIGVLRRSQPLICLAILLAMATALISETTHFALVTIAATAAITVYFRLKYDWSESVMFCLVMTYLTHLLWLFNNPLMGRPLGLLPEHHWNLLYLVAYASLFGVSNLPKRKSTDSDLGNIALTLFNGAGFYALSLLVAHAYYQHQFAGLNLMFSVFSLALASAYWLYRESQFSTSFYACFGYMALTVAIISHFESPVSFIWLGWQSLLVVSSAIWFRSKIVVVANMVIYLGILIYYLSFVAPDLAVNMSYAAVALLSARILNWQRERLTLYTESMRNIYLASALVIVPYGLSYGVAGDYISVSWLGAALFFFALNLALHNTKYRWMAIWMLFLTVGRVVLIDMASLSPAFRIVSFMVVGVTMLVVSWMYARYRKETTDET
jgi:hypothetical protein